MCLKTDLGCLHLFPEPYIAFTLFFHSHQAKTSGASFWQKTSLFKRRPERSRGLTLALKTVTSAEREGCWLTLAMKSSTQSLAQSPTCDCNDASMAMMK